MKTKAILLLLGALTFGAIFWFLSYSVVQENPYSSSASEVMADVARLYPRKIQRKIQIQSVETLQQVLKEAKEKKWKISLAGSHHSQGGHIYSENGITLDMRGFNKIISIDPEKKLLTAQSGATWNDIQKAINPLGLAVKVMQSSYVFTLGGTLSANAHGRDLDKTTVVETVRGFRLLKTDGSIVQVSRTENPELFRLVIGGYGLFGIVLEVDLELTANEVYEREAEVINYRDFPEYFQKQIKENKGVGLFLARPSFAADSFMEEIVVTKWNKTNKTTSEKLMELGEEENVERDRVLFGWSRDFAWGKNLRWFLQKKFESSPGEKILISRNNSMRPPATPLKLLDYFSKRNTDIIQEYFIPTENFVSFMEDFKEALKKSNLNVLSSTIRYVKANHEVDLSYAPNTDCFAIIQMSNVGLSTEEQARTEQATRALVEVALKWGGTYYLTYQLYPTGNQFLRAYPLAREFFEKKKKYDPDEVLSSLFYEHYKKEIFQ